MWAVKATFVQEGDRMGLLILRYVFIYLSIHLSICFICVGSAEDGTRVVFMVDLWHPNVAAAERQALDYIFTPGRLEDKEGK